MVKTKVYTMTQEFTCLTKLDEWQALSQHHYTISEKHLRDWFYEDPLRFDRYSLSFQEILFDYSRNRINDQTLRLLEQLAHATHLPAKINALFSGQPINITEKRAALHTALRDRNHTPIFINNENIKPLIEQTLQKMRDFTQSIHARSRLGVTGKPLRHIVTIGVGGSYLGTLMCCHALKDFAVSQLQFHFISSIDKTLMRDVLSDIDPETTLFIISSKTFSTMETMTNARTLVAWMQERLGKEALIHHFAAITSQPEKAQAFGLTPALIFNIWDWVGGRYSIWSSIGLPLMLMIGANAFDDFLEGAFAMDEHFRQAPFLQNMPVLMALLSIWYMNFFKSSAQAIIPYAHRLRYLIPYLQQADMESNGKHTNLQGKPVPYATGPVIFGEEGCNGQHSYHQLLHQGQHLIPVDFILLGKTATTQRDMHQDILVASGLSQAQALMLGRNLTEAQAFLQREGYAPEDIATLAHHQVNPGNRPSNVLFLECLNPKNLGALLALYEHKIFVQGAIWNINSFDQWGVELGKQLLPPILNHVQGDTQLTLDSATLGLIQHFRKIQGET